MSPAAQDRPKVDYIAAPQKRYAGFFIQSMAVFALSLGALGRIIYLTAS